MMEDVEEFLRNDNALLDLKDEIDQHLSFRDDLAGLPRTAPLSLVSIDMAEVCMRGKEFRWVKKSSKHVSILLIFNSLLSSFLYRFF